MTDTPPAGPGQAEVDARLADGPEKGDPQGGDGGRLAVAADDDDLHG